MELTTELLSTGGTTTGFEVPDSLVEGLGGGRHPKVVVTVNGFTYRTSIARMGDRYMLGVSAERRAAAGLAAGEVVTLAIELDTAPREIEVPPALAAALAANEAASTFWATLSYSKQQWHTLQVSGAKTDETRARRVAKSIELLSSGKAR
ncbi:MAG: DUF1905 domain-containing protein [Chloroflexi bacterium]|nr:YdeI/OmpD-associated family protein [Chloroflexota bacterium]MQC83213.1 DUF1905 domain-containing protein [Chloroflexota bacterium]